ncbi:MAG: hypothetical protein WCV73_01905 [Patescibacteria group bacterium]|jgi:hypothetical protein
MKIHLPNGWPQKTIRLQVNVLALQEKDIQEVYPCPTDSQQIGLEIKGVFHRFGLQPEWAEQLQALDEKPFGNAVFHGHPGVLILKAQSTGELVLELKPAHYDVVFIGC